MIASEITGSAATGSGVGGSTPTSGADAPISVGSAPGASASVGTESNDRTEPPESIAAVSMAVAGKASGAAVGVAWTCASMSGVRRTVAAPTCGAAAAGSGAAGGAAGGSGAGGDADGCAFSSRRRKYSVRARRSLVRASGAM